MVGKVGNYYWVEMTSQKKPVRRGEDPSLPEERTFNIYDTRMNLVNQVVPLSPAASPLKEYLVAAEDHFDQVELMPDRAPGERGGVTGGGHGKIAVWVQRYESDGRPLSDGRLVAEYPFYESGNSFLLVRSKDRQRLLLLGFEFRSDLPPRVHAFLFDNNWRILSNRVYTHPYLTQPAIQDDYTSYPIDDFNSGPIKLANNGQWLMTAPSRTNNNYLLFHFNAADTGIFCKEITLPPASVMEDVSLSIDNERADAACGILSDFHYSTLKNARVIRYSMLSKSFLFDSAYRLTTLGGGRVRNGNLVKESFMAVPGQGFLLLKEYGRPFEEGYDGDHSFDEGWDPAALFADNNIPDPGPDKSLRRPLFSMAKNGYARYPSLGGPPDHERGDLSLYYFPAAHEDSCWSGLISKEQITELNSPNLSYLFVPVKDKLFFLYNSFVHNDNLYGSTTVLDRQGGLVSDEGVLFWGLKNTLSFQHSRQMGPDQIVIPYEIYSDGRPGYRIGKIGFAVVSFR